MNKYIICAVALLGIATTSCINKDLDINLKDIKNSIGGSAQLGGAHLALPLGSTDTLYVLRDQLDTADVELLSLIDGKFYIKMADSVITTLEAINPIEVPIPANTDTIPIPTDVGIEGIKDKVEDAIQIDTPTESNMGISVPPGLTTGSALPLDYAPTIDTAKAYIKVNIDFALPSQIASVDTIEFGDGTNLGTAGSLVKLSLDFSDFHNSISTNGYLDTVKELTLVFPDNFIIERASVGTFPNSHTLSIINYEVTGQNDVEFPFYINYLMPDHERRNDTTRMIIHDSIQYTFVFGAVVKSGATLTSPSSGTGKYEINAALIKDDLKYNRAKVTTTDIEIEFDNQSIAVNSGEIEIPDMLKRIDRLYFEKDGTDSVKFTISDPGLPIPFKDGSEVVLTFPSVFQFDNPAIGTFNNNAWAIPANKLFGAHALHIQSLDFAKDGQAGTTIELDVNGKMLLLNDSITITSPNHLYLQGSLWSEELDNLKDQELRIAAQETNLEVKSVTAIVSPKIDPMHQGIELASGLPDFLKSDSTNLALQNSVIRLSIDNPTSIQLKLETDFRGDDGNPIEVNLDIAAGETSKFYVAEKNHPTEDGVYKEANIPGLIATLPDSIFVDVTPTVDTLTPIDIDLADLATDQEVKVHYEVDVPLDLGPGFKIAYKDTVKIGDGLKVLDDYKASATLELLMHIINTMPLGLDLHVYPLDENEVPLDLNITITGKIPASGEDILSLSLSEKKDKPGELAKLYHLGLEVIAKSSEVGGVLKDDQYVIINIGAKVPGGVTVNVEDFLNK
ncbi:hypothetical protein AGMMS4956_06840 [Bacteroidia bacterium]|nr:hypothetical protein AGMMS4956_06840 [Bacteroidia bacterium]